MNKIILGIVEPDWYGVKRALSTFCDEIVTPVEAIQKIEITKPRIVVLGCFKAEWKNVSKAAKKVGAKVVATWYASFILNEFDDINRKWMAAMIKEYKDGNIDVIAVAHKGLSEAFNKLGIKTDFLPCIFKSNLPKIEKIPGINIGILGSGMPWKNMECQIVAALLIPEAKIHIQYLKNWDVIKALGLKHKIIVHPHIKSDEEYYKLAGGMTINMIVSLSEVYSYLGIESILMDTPILTSSITPIFKNKLLPNILEYCKTPYFEDPVDMADNMQKILANYKNIQKIGKDYVLKFIEEENKIAKSVIDSW